MPRRSVVVGNWKSNKTVEEARRIARRLRAGLERNSDVDVLVAPPFTAFEAVAGVLGGSNIQLAAQNVHWEGQGPWTGEITTDHLIDLDCHFVIVGHSERRQFFNETSETVNLRVQKVVKEGLSPIVCIGETLEERDQGRAEEVIIGDLERSLSGLTGQDLFRIIIAYEPVWAIGTGRTATPEMAQEIHSKIRAWLCLRYSPEISDSVRILYGGSVGPENVSELMCQTDIDGALVGGASLNSETFIEIALFGDR